MAKRNAKGQFVKGTSPWNKGKKVRTNTGKTHFKKGDVPWNKGKPHKKIRGRNHYKWRGGWWIDKDGYRVIERKRVEGYYRYFEHRRIMEKYLGRKLEDHEDVHHIDGDKLNNHISNLRLMNKSDHTKLHKGGGVR